MDHKQGLHTSIGQYKGHLGQVSMKQYLISGIGQAPRLSLVQPIEGVFMRIRELQDQETMRNSLPSGYYQLPLNFRCLEAGQLLNT